MTAEPQPIPVSRIAELLRQFTDLYLPGATDAEHDGAFEMTVALTGQRFRVTVTELPPWPARLDAQLEELLGENTEAGK